MNDLEPEQLREPQLLISPIDCPEKRLILSVLLRAIFDAKSNKHRDRRSLFIKHEAKAWFYETDPEPDALTFDMACTFLSNNPHTFRKKILELVESPLSIKNKFNYFADRHHVQKTKWKRRRKRKIIRTSDSSSIF